MKPEVKKTLSGYIFNWNEDELSIKVSRLKIHKDGRVTGELLITTTSKDFNSPILHPPTQINFVADRTRKELANTLKEKYSRWDWIKFIDQLAYKVQELEREGEPTKEIWTYEDISPPEYLLEPFLIKGLTTVIFGEKGVRKSGIAILIAICLLLPWHDNPLGIKVPDKSFKSLILDWETERDVVIYEAKRLQVGMDLPDFPIYYRRCNSTLADDIEEIQKHIEEIGADVIIIDSLGAAAGGELNKAEIAIAFFTALRKLKRTSIVIAQTSKSEEGRKSIFGSTYFTYYARSIFEICKADDIDEDNLHIALFHRWCNPFKTHPPIGFNFQFNDKGIKVERESVTISEFMNKISRKLQIIEFLKSGIKDTKEIANELGISESSARVTLNRNKNIFKHHKNGWGLLEKRYAECYENGENEARLLP